ncbi:MAG TPA: Fic family protein [Thermoanaerobaculia bacterium]|nr:Fic family protein [Thermoanaerobaculia bacterium]
MPRLLPRPQQGQGATAPRHDACLVLDFLSIHSFRDGNGRVSRLLTLLVLDQHGHEVGRYISLERLVEETRVEYYDVLRRSSEAWHEGWHDLLPWLNYFLPPPRLRRARGSGRPGQSSPRSEDRHGRGGGRRPARDFTLAELERACPGMSHDLVRRVLRQIQGEGRVECVGRGRGGGGRRGLDERLSAEFRKPGEQVGCGSRHAPMTEDHAA